MCIVASELLTCWELLSARVMLSLCTVPFGFSLGDASHFPCYLNQHHLPHLLQWACFHALAKQLHCYIPCTILGCPDFLNTLLSSCLPKWLYHVAFLPAINENLCCSASLTVINIAIFLDFSYSNSCVVISHCFNLHLPNDKYCWTYIDRLTCYIYVFFVKVSV